MTSIDRVAVVTGSAGGIGAACAERLAQDGLVVAIVDIKAGKTTVERIAAIGGKARAYTCDVTNADQVAALTADVMRDFGGCDVLVNNAGRYEFTPTASVTFETWRKIMSLNLDGMFLTTQAFVPGMRRKRWGRIINIASNSCFSPPPGLTAYVASKSASIGYVRSLAGELGAEGITVNAVAPGPIVTEQLRASFYAGAPTEDPGAFDVFMATLVQQQAIPRAGVPNDVAKVVSFFASDASEFVTGQTLVIDGGLAKH